MARAPLEFYFDLSSPYAYLTSTWIDKLAAKYDRTVKWQPILLGPAFKETGMRPLFHQPMRGNYGVRDFLRSAHLLGVQAVVPKAFPYISLKAARCFYWLELNQPKYAVMFAKACFKEYFVNGRAPTTNEILAPLAQNLGCDHIGMIAGHETMDIKAYLQHINDQALAKGVFGAPYVIVDGEPFWGNDRKDQIEFWLKTGGF